AEQMRLLGNTLVQSMRDPSDASPREFAAYVASEPIKVASDMLDISQPAMLARIASFIQGIEIEFGRGANKSRTSKAPSKTIGVSVYTWRKKEATFEVRTLRNAVSRVGFCVSNGWRI